MLRFYLKDKRSLWLFAADLLILSGVLYFKWNPDRIILFYCFDLGLCVLSFVVYNVILKGYTMIPNALTASIIVVGPIYFLVKSLLTPPYFDFSIFLTFSILAHVYDVKKYLQYEASVAQPGFALYTGMLFVLIPILYYLPKLFETLGISLDVSTVLTFILIRHFVEYKRYKKFIDIEKEVKRFYS